MQGHNYLYLYNTTSQLNNLIGLEKQVEVHFKHVRYSLNLSIMFWLCISVISWSGPAVGGLAPP